MHVKLPFQLAKQIADRLATTGTIAQNLDVWQPLRDCIESTVEAQRLDHVSDAERRGINRGRNEALAEIQRRQSDDELNIGADSDDRAGT